MQTILSCSIKGGVGKTTVAVGTARALQRRGLRVGILDLDYRSPCVPLVMGADDALLDRTPADALVPVEAQGLYLFSMGFIWPPEQCVMVGDDAATEDVRQLLRPGVIAWPQLDYLVVDTPPTSSGVVRVALDVAGAAGAILVTQPSRVARAATVRTLDLFAEKQVPVYALISNQGMEERGRDRDGFLLTGQHRYDLTDTDILSLAQQHQIPIFLAIPHTRDLDPHFDRLAAMLVGTSPVLLPKPPELEGASWQRVIQWAQKVSA